MNNSKESELIRLRKRILEAIRISEHYWLIFKDQTFGIATILDLKYKRQYIEILFFTSFDIKKGNSPIKINIQSDTQYDFKKILKNLYVNEDGVVNPAKVIEEINKLIKEETEYHTNVLNNEVRLIDFNFENHQIENNPYRRKIRLVYPEIILKVNINFENFPNTPKLIGKNPIVVERLIKTYREKIREKLREKFKEVVRNKTEQLTLIYNEILREKLKKKIKKNIRISIRQKINVFKRIYDEKFKEKIKAKFIQIITPNEEKLKALMTTLHFNTEILRNWNIEKPHSVFEVIKSLFEVKEGAQQLILKKITIPNVLKKLSFKVLRGQSIGILYDSKQPNILKEKSLTTNLFNIIAGKNSNYSGKIEVFGKEIQSEKKHKKEDIFIVSHKIDPALENMKIKKAIQYKTKIKPKWKIRKRIVEPSSKSTGFLSRIYETISLPPKYNTSKSFIYSALEATGLLNKKKEKISKLSPIERLMFSITQALVKNPNIIMFSIPTVVDLERNIIEKLNRHLNRIKRRFHVILIVHGPKEIVSNCNQIIKITGRTAVVGSIEYFISKIPHSGEIITIELNNPDKEILEKLLKLQSAMFIEERKDEKYKIFCLEDPDTMVMKLMDLVGESIFSFKRYRASMAEYLELLEIM